MDGIMSRTFEHFPHDKHCPLCGTNQDEACTLIGVDGTQDGGIEEALPVHVVCLMNGKYWRVNKTVGVVYTRLAYGATMTAIDNAILNLERLYTSFMQQGNMTDAKRTMAEWTGWCEVRDGKPENLAPFHHVEYRQRYLQARADAKTMKGGA